MALNFEDTYPPIDVSGDLRIMHFNSFGDEQVYLLRANIDNVPHYLMPDVYNLSFGPPEPGSATGVMDDVKVRHFDLDRVFSTLLLFAFTYLSNNPEHYIGIDGSCNRRALLYFKKIRQNLDSLHEYFKVIAGVKYYARLKRFPKPCLVLTDEKQQAKQIAGIAEHIDLEDIKAIPDQINQFAVVKGVENNFNYFIFRSI
jgi:hypothetical protein